MPLAGVSSVDYKGRLPRRIRIRRIWCRFPNLPDTPCWGSSYSSISVSSRLQVPASSTQSHRQSDQAPISGNTQRSQNHHRIPTGSKFIALDPILPDLREKLAVTLTATEQTDDEDPGSVDSEERADAIEFRGEDPEDNKRKGVLGEGGADVGTFKRALGRSYFDNLVGC